MYVHYYLFCASFVHIFSSPELIGLAGIRRASLSSVHPQFSEASGPILIVFDVNHQWVGVLIALGFGADCVKTMVSMATDGLHRRTMGKTKKIFFSETTRPNALIYGLWQSWLRPSLINILFAVTQPIVLGLSRSVCNFC